MALCIRVQGSFKAQTCHADSVFGSLCECNVIYEEIKSKIQALPLLMLTRFHFYLQKRLLALVDKLEESFTDILICTSRSQGH